MANAFDTYQRYLAYKRHFTSNYDFFKYGGKSNCKVTTFEKRPDKFHFGRLARRADWDEYLLALLLDNPERWVGDMFSEEAEAVYTAFCKRKHALTYTFSQDIEKLDKDFNKNFVVVDVYPPLLEKFLVGDIAIETMVILDDLVGYRKQWDKQIKEHYVWPTVSNKIRKYRPFLRYEKQKFKKKLLEFITE